jgi:hypothetical protein
MDCAGIRYDQRDNCFVWVTDPVAAQQLLDQQLRPDSKGELKWQALRRGQAAADSTRHSKFNPGK